MVDHVFQMGKMPLPFFFGNRDDPFQSGPALVLPFQIGRIFALVADAIDDAAAQLDIGNSRFTVSAECFPLIVAGTPPFVDFLTKAFGLFQDGRDGLSQFFRRMQGFQPFDEAFRYVISGKEEAFVLHSQLLMQGR